MAKTILTKDDLTSEQIAALKNYSEKLSDHLKKSISEFVLAYPDPVLPMFANSKESVFIEAVSTENLFHSACRDCPFPM